jgi:hypothetical protein
MAARAESCSATWTGRTSSGAWPRRAGPRGCGLAYRQVNRLHESKGYSRTARRAGGKAERIIGERLKGPGRREADLSQQPKSDPVKV